MESSGDRIPQGTLTTTEFARLVETLPHDEVVRRCRALSDLDFLLLRRHESSAATDALLGDDLDPIVLEPGAKRLEILAEADPDEERRRLLLGTVYELRHARELRTGQQADYERTRPTARELEAMGLVASCYEDEPDDARLGRIAAAMRRIDELGAGAESFREESGIGAQAEILSRLREALELTRDPRNPTG